MSSVTAKPLLMTKLHIPAPRPDLVPHPRLIKRLNAGAHHTPGVTLISTPVGYSKTTPAYYPIKRRCMAYWPA